MPISARRDRRRRSQYLQEESGSQDLVCPDFRNASEGQSGVVPSRLHPMSQESVLLQSVQNDWPIDRLYLLQVILDGQLDGRT